MRKYKNFYIPLFFAIFTSLAFHLFQNTQYAFTNYIDKMTTLTIADSKPLTFYIASDIHYLSKDLKDNSESFRNFILRGDGKNILYVTEIFDSLVYDISENKPDFLILSGDLTFNGELTSHFDLSKKLSEIEKLGTSVYVIPGNHDINNPWARGFKDTTQYKTETLSANDFADIYKNFGYKEAIYKDDDSLSYLVSPSKDLYLLMLDTCLYDTNLKYNIPEMSGEVSKGTLDWIIKCGKLAKNKGAKIIAVTHHNLMNHSDYVYDGYTLENSEALLSTFKDANISLNFSGHIHKQSIKTRNYTDYSITDIASSSLCTFPSKYGIFTYDNGSISYNTKIVDVEKYASVNKIADNNLINFKTYSLDFYKTFIINQNTKSLTKLNRFTSEDINEICNTISNIRVKYDYKLNDISWSDIINSKGFSLMKDINSIYVKHYMKIAIDGNETTNNTGKFTL